MNTARKEDINFPSCRHAGIDHPRVIHGRHLDSCHGTPCRGCEPCAAPHCRLCGHHAGDLLCPGCLKEIRDDLAEIPKLVAKLPPEALARGAASEAFHLAGPTANHQAWAQRIEHGHHYEHDAHLGENHPYWVLGQWDLHVTDLLGHTRTTAVTVAGAADYLRRNLSDLAKNPDFPINDLADQVHGCRTHLEAVLHDGEQIEKGAPCLTCKRPVTRTTDTTGKVTYRCERCKRTLTDNEYRLAVSAAHVAHADRLNSTDLAERVGVPESSLRRWASVVKIQPKGGDPIALAPLMRSCGTDSKGRKVYKVAEALRIKNTGGDQRRTGKMGE